tara:strand:- start:1909 stop:2241 length:333 start_codon:yes stop_codon:yes gene_type:complete
MWYDVLKIKQITTPVTDINIKKVPKKKKEIDCCQEAKDNYKKRHVANQSLPATIEEYDIMYSSTRQIKTGNYGGWANKSCKEFREYLERGHLASTSGKILIQWNKCEGRD